MTRRSSSGRPDDRLAAAAPSGNGTVGGFYRWTCPICDETGVGSAVPGRARSRAANALTTHVRITDGRDHGPRHELPRDWDADDVDRHVRRIDG